MPEDNQAHLPYWSQILWWCSDSRGAEQQRTDRYKLIQENCSRQIKPDYLDDKLDHRNLHFQPESEQWLSRLIFHETLNQVMSSRDVPVSLVPCTSHNCHTSWIIYKQNPSTNLSTLAAVYIRDPLRVIIMVIQIEAMHGSREEMHGFRII